jgi:hypothetical protein
MIGRGRKIEGKVSVEISKGVSRSVSMFESNAEDCLEICSAFCESEGLPRKVAAPLALRLRRCYQTALAKYHRQKDGDDVEEEEDGDGLERAREENDAPPPPQMQTPRSKKKMVILKDEPSKENVVNRNTLITSNPSEMARKIAEMKRVRQEREENEDKNVLNEDAFRLAMPTSGGSWNQIATGELTMQTVGKSTRVLRVVEKPPTPTRVEELALPEAIEQQQQQQQREEEDELFEVVVESNQNNDLANAQPYLEKSSSEEEEEEEEEMLEFEITPTKQDFSSREKNFVRESDWFAEKVIISEEANDDSSESEEIVHHSSPSVKDSIKKLNASLDSTPKKEQHQRSPTMTAPHAIAMSPMEMKSKRKTDTIITLDAQVRDLKE